MKARAGGPRRRPRLGRGVGVAARRDPGPTRPPRRVGPGVDVGRPARRRHVARARLVGGAGPRAALRRRPRRRGPEADEGARRRGVGEDVARPSASGPPVAAPPQATSPTARGPVRASGPRVAVQGTCPTQARGAQKSAGLASRSDAHARPPVPTQEGAPHWAHGSSILPSFSVVDVKSSFARVKLRGVSSVKELRILYP